MTFLRSVFRILAYLPQEMGLPPAVSIESRPLVQETQESRMSQVITDGNRLLLPPDSWSRNDRAPSNLKIKRQISNSQAGHPDFMPPLGLQPRRRGHPHPRREWPSQHRPWSSTRPDCLETAPLKTSSTTARPSRLRDVHRQHHPRRGTTPSPNPSSSTRPSFPSRHPLNGSTRDALPNAGGYRSPRPSPRIVQ